MTSLEEKLLAAKQVMDKLGDNKPVKSNNLETIRSTPTNTITEDIEPDDFMANIPSMESIIGKKYNMPPKSSMSEEAIKKSRLPENIKKLMIEHPIPDPPQAGNTQFSPEFLKKIGKNMPISETKTRVQTERKQVIKESSNNPNLKQLIKESLREILPAMIDEKIKEVIGEAHDINEIFALRIGNNLFSGKFTKQKEIKK